MFRPYFRVDDIEAKSFEEAVKEARKIEKGDSRIHFIGLEEIQVPEGPKEE